MHNIFVPSFPKSKSLLKLSNFREKRNWFNDLQKNIDGGIITSEMLECLIDYLKNTKLFARFEWDAEDGVSLNRHKLSHGRLANYDTKANSLRIILLLDSIFHIIQYRREFEK